jgi:hypothetical protein
MKNLFNDISQEERNRILEMHQSATRKNYLSEQAATAPAPATTGPVTGGAANPNQIKITKIKTSPDDLNRFVGFSTDEILALFPKLTPFKTQNDWNSVKVPLQQALTWYGKSGRNPSTNVLSSVVSNIGGDFPERYQLLIKGNPSASGQGFVADAKTLDNQMKVLYNNQLNKV